MADRQKSEIALMDKETPSLSLLWRSILRERNTYKIHTNSKPRLCGRLLLATALDQSVRKESRDPRGKINLKYTINTLPRR